MSLSLAENVIVAGADNRPPMLDKTQYSLPVSRMLLYIKVRKMEKESKLYDEFDTFTSEPRETIHLYYLRSNATGTRINRIRGTNRAGLAKVIRCYNCQEKGHMARQCTKPKRPRNSIWFKEKAMLIEALELGVVFDEEQMAFLADNVDIVTSSQSSQEPTHDNYLDNHVIDQIIQEMQYSEQPIFNNDTNIDITNDSNMISYDQYLKETKNAIVQDTSFAQLEAMIMSVIEEMTNQAQRKVPAFYCGHTIVKKHDALSVIDTKETLELVAESRLKMHAKQNDTIAKEKKVNIAPIDYAALNKLSEHFVKHFVPPKQLYVEHAFWLPISKPASEIPPV
ncbi:retrovirus-related pol polyprotein from transposon TNT 1-94 [Tanacetum coccineum]